jgi:hypothetical protein
MATWWRSVWVHGLFGPLVGALVASALVSGGASPPGLADVGALLALSYLFGLGPAVMAGLLFGVVWRLSRPGRQRYPWGSRLEAAAGIGAVSGLLGCLAFVALMGRMSPINGSGWWVWLAAALAGAVCGAYTARP